MKIEIISVMVLLVLGLVGLRILWPAKGRAADWRVLYEAAMSEKSSDVLRTLIYDAERAVQSRQKELQSESSASPAEREDFANAATALVRLKSEKLSWPVQGRF